MGDSPRILLIEDEQSIADAVVWTLGKEGFEVVWASTITDGLARLGEGIRLVLLDVGLPDGSGFDACRAIRSRSDIPVVFLSARGDEFDRVLGLEIGGDDYLVKPFSPRELAARVRARLRTHHSSPAAAEPQGAGAPRPIEGTEFVHDAAARRFRFRGRDLPLTAAETRILECLLAHPGRVVSRQELVDRALGEDSPSLERTIDAHVKSLRGKLREAVPDADPIETRRGFGYAARKTA
jgi:two-component system catabolic regulation response regulator CreB